MNRNLRDVLLICIVLAAGGAAMEVSAQAYPSRPITMIVPTGPGGTTDIVARIMTPRLGDILGRPVVVENKLGAGGIIGTQYAAKALPDGHTLMMSSNQIAMIPPLYKTAPFDPMGDFVPVTSIGMIPTVVVVNPSISAKSMQDLIVQAKANPERFSFGSAGNGSPNHLFGELLNNAAGIKVQHIPYKGIAAAISDVVGGRVSMAYASLPTVKSFVESGKLKALAITSPQRSPSVPGVPAISESVAGYGADIWIGLWGIANTPDAVVSQVHAATLKTMNDPEVNRRLVGIGLVLEPRTQAQFRALIEAELAKWSRIVNESKGAIERQ